MSASATTMPTAATAPPVAATRGSALLRLCATELKLLSRERVRVGITVLLPLALLVILGSIHALRQPEAVYNGYSFIDKFTIVLVVTALALQSLTTVPMILADYRERGVLRRLQTTPIGALRVLTAQVVADLAVAVVGVGLILVVARVAFGVALPREVAAYVVTALLAAASLLAIGLMIAAVAPTGRVARGIGVLVFYVLNFFSGLILPLNEMPATLQHISHATPLGAAVSALDHAAVGSWPTALQLGTMAAWAVALGLGAAKFFRWE
jgi:ABC-2 type transport system permease protein